MVVHTPRSYFYPDQLRRLLYQHIENESIGYPTVHNITKPYWYSIVRPNRFRFVYELWSANYLPLNFYISMRHIYKGPSPGFYARAKAELMNTGRHPMFSLVDGWSPLRRFGMDRDTRAPLHTPLPVHTLDRMARLVWEKLPFHSVYSRSHAFTLIMTALEGRLTLEKLVERAANGTLPKKWKPVTFAFQEVELASDRLLDRKTLLVPSQRAKARFWNPIDICFCVPLYSRFCGTFASVTDNKVDFFEDLPAYFVAKEGKRWKLFLSDARKTDIEPVAQDNGNPEDCQTKIIDAINRHLVTALLNSTGEQSLLLNLAREKFYKVTLVPLSASDCVQCYEDMLACYLNQLQKVFDKPENYTDKEGDKVKTELEVMVYQVMREAFERFFPGRQ